MLPNFSASALRQRLLQVLLLCLLMLPAFRSQASILNCSPQILGAKGGGVRIQASFLEGFVSKDKTVGVYDTNQKLIGAVELQYAGQIGLSIFYEASFDFPANYAPYDVGYYVYAYTIGSAPLTVSHVTSPVILDVTTQRTLGAAGRQISIDIKYSQNDYVPYLYGYSSLRLKIQNPDGKIFALDGSGYNYFHFISSDSVSNTYGANWVFDGNYGNTPQVYKLTASIAELPWLPDFDGGTVTVTPCVTPVIQSVTTNRIIGAAGDDYARIFIKCRINASDAPYIDASQALRLKIQNPNGTSTIIGGGSGYGNFYYSSGDSASSTFYNYDNIRFMPNYTNAPQVYKLTASITWLPYLPDFDGGTVTVLPAMANVSGTLALDSLASNALPQVVTFTFRPADNTAPIIKTANVDATGIFSLNGIPRKPYQLHIKADKFLAANVDIDTTNSDTPNIVALLPAGDANNDNSVDSTDFGILIGAYGSSASDPGSGYDATADFNGDGSVDSTDFGLLIGNFNLQGAP